MNQSRVWGKTPVHGLYYDIIARVGVSTPLKLLSLLYFQPHTYPIFGCVGRVAKEVLMKNNIRSRAFACVLYPEDFIHKDILNFITLHFDYAYILHDKDRFEDGSLKKPHYHVIIKFQNPRSLSKLKEILNLNYIETCNFYSYSRYLIHLDDLNKHQYSRACIISNIREQVLACLGPEICSSNLDAKILLDYIKTNKPNFYELTFYAHDFNLLTELKKNAFFYKSLVERR